MTPQEIAEVRPRLLAFAGEMLGGLPRKDQRAAGELYVRGLLTDGQRKSMQPMAARLGVDHQRLQQFITSSTWDYAGGAAECGAVVRGQPAGGGAGGRRHRVPQGRDGVAVRGPAVLRDAGQDRQLPGRGQRAPGERARLVRGGLAAVLPGVLGRCRAGRSGRPRPVPGAAASWPRIPDQVRHTEKWRLALEMIDEMTGPGGWGVLEQITAGRWRPRRWWWPTPAMATTPPSGWS